MSIDRVSTWAFCEEHPGPDPALERLRNVGIELGASPVSHATGALLRVLAATKDARAVIEIGTGVGVSGLFLLQGMNPNGVLTTIDSEPEFHRAARTTFRGAGVASHRTRFITDRALDVLPRMAKAAYDMFVVDAPARDMPRYLDHAARMLRKSGLLVIINALDHGQVANPAKRAPSTVIMREMLRALQESDQFHSSLIPASDGIEIAVRT
jgi:Predicted O-methyltransferase